MSRALIVLGFPIDRQRAHRWIDQAPVNTRLEFRAPRRSIPQNDRMWAMLTEVSRQVDWFGQRYTPEDWKDYAMHALKRARWMPSEDGGMVPIGMRTSDLSKEEMSDLIEFLFAFGAEHDVQFQDGSEGPDRANNPAGAAA